MKSFVFVGGVDSVIGGKISGGCVWDSDVTNSGRKNSVYVFRKLQWFIFSFKIKCYKVESMTDNNATFFGGNIIMQCDL